MISNKPASYSRFLLHCRYYKDSGKLKASVKGLGLSMDFFLDVDDEGQLEVVPTYCTSTRGTVSITKMTGNL